MPIVFHRSRHFAVPARTNEKMIQPDFTGFGGIGDNPLTDFGITTKREGCCCFHIQASAAIPPGPCPKGNARDAIASSFIANRRVAC